MNTQNDTWATTARENLRMAVALRNTNLAEVSRRAGMSRNGLSQYLSGSTSLSYANMLNICDVLKIPIGILHRPDAISNARIRLHQALDRLPDHLAAQALADAQDMLGNGQA